MFCFARLLIRLSRRSVRLRGPQFLYLKYASILGRHTIVEDSPKVFICTRLRKIQKALPSFATFAEWKTVTLFFGRFADTQPLLCRKLHTHFAKILNSQLKYTVILLLQRVKEAFLPTFSHFCKHGFFRGFTVRIPRVTSISSIAFFGSLRFCLRHRKGIASSAFQNSIWVSEWSGRTGSFVGICCQ